MNKMAGQKYQPTIQCQVLREAIRKVGIKSKYTRSGFPHVRTQRVYEGIHNGKPQYRYGYAEAIIDYIISDEEEKQLREFNDRFKIRRHPEGGFTYIAS